MAYDPNHPIMDDDDAVFADGQRTTCSHSSSAELLEKLMARDGLNRAVALSVLETVQEHEETFGPLGRGGRQMAPAADKFRVRFLEIMDEFARAATMWDVRLVLWVLDDPRVDDALNHESPASWCKSIGISKEMCYRRAEDIRVRLKLPKRRDQRSEAACDNMKKARLKRK